jgi:hypothetical protein
MSKNKSKYTQCKLQIIDNGSIETAWIVSDKAIKNAIIDVGDNKGNLKTVRVLAVGCSTERDMPLFQNDWIRAKKRTDI